MASPVHALMQYIVADIRVWSSVNLRSENKTRATHDPIGDFLSSNHDLATIGLVVLGIELSPHVSWGYVDFGQVTTIVKGCKHMNRARLQLNSLPRHLDPIIRLDECHAM